MIRNWDEELVEDREFRIGGELFEFVYPHWEIGAKIFDESLSPPSTNGDDPEGSAEYYKKDTQFAIERIPMFLNPKNESHKRWKALMARKTDAVPRHQVVQLYGWLVQVTGGLPTTPPSSAESGGGAGTTEASSSDVSSSTEATSTA